jgi:PAS domain S-box-containing protein
MGVLPYEGDQFRGSVGVLRDVSTREERGRELREHRALLQQSLDALDDVFFIFGADRELLRWNDRLLEVTGYTDDELEGMSPSEFFPDDHVERIETAVEEVFETGHAQARADYLLKDGTRVPYEFKATRIEGPDGDVLGFAGIGRDITGTLEYERRLERQNERLEEFASVLSHDLRNPLNVAEGRLDIERERRQSDHLDAVAEAHDRVQTLIGKLLTLARDGEIATDRQSVSVGAQAEESWATMATGEASLVVEDDLTVEADESRLQQLLENLLRNAVDHGPEGVTVRVGALPDDRGFYVADDGPGIPPDERDRVFENGYTTGSDGIGAGLSIVKRVVDAHGWAVGVTESRGGGTRFEIGTT